MTRMMSKEQEFPVGSWERPDAGGIVKRGEATSMAGFVEKFGEAPDCFVGYSGSESGCERKAVMEVYGLHFCEAHGEEAAAGALEEIAHDLEQYLDLPTHPHNGSLSPHVYHALYTASHTIPDLDSEVQDAALLAAFPLIREQVDSETLLYIKGPDGDHLPPYDNHLHDRLIVCRHMRESFEAKATWLVEALEKERETSAAQAAYALVLEREAGLI